MPKPTIGMTNWGDDLNDYLDTLATRSALDVRDYGAIGGGLGTTITASGASLATIQSDSGQAWLAGTDSMDLAAFYLAQAEAEDTGRSILFPRDDYVFTGPGLLNAGVKVDLGGSTVTSTVTDTSRFVRSNRVFLLGILAVEDFDRFDSEGWTHTADNIAQDATTITNLTGTMPGVGDVLLIRTTAESGDLPDYVTFNEVTAVAGDDVTLRWPVELAITSPIIVNYSTITTLKSALVGTGEPHVYYCAHGSSLTNGTLIATDGPAFEVNAALDTDIDVRIVAPKGQAVYGNGWNRCRVRVAGTCGGPKGPVELALGSALSTVNVDLRYSGIDSDSAGSVSGNYAHIQLGEHTESCVVTGTLRMAAKPANQGVTFPTGNRNTVNVEMVGRGITASAVVFASNAGTGNRASGRYEVSSSADYYCSWSAGTGTDNWLENARFVGTPGTNSLRFLGPSLGGARGVVAPEGQLLIDSGATGNVVIDSYIAAGIGSAGARGSFIDIKTSLGSWPEKDVIVSYNASTALLAREVQGRTVTNTGATAVRTMVLPVSVAGMHLRAVRDSASWAFRIDPNGSEIVGTGGAGKYLELQTNGGYVNLRCNVAGTWVIESSLGTIAYEP